jgi:hypothetical protein
VTRKSSVLLALFIFSLNSAALRSQAGLAASTPYLYHAAAFPQRRETPRQPSQMEIDAERQRAKMANQERQARLKKDTDQLLKLATELKEAVDKSNEHTLSLEVIEKATDIEKLAKSVREKMKADAYMPLPGADLQIQK